MNGFDTIVEQSPQRVYVLFVFGRDKDTVLAEARHPGFLQVLEGEVLALNGREVVFLFGDVGEVVDLVEDDDGRFVLFAYIGDGLLDHFVLLLEVRMGDIHYMDEQIGFAHFVQGRFEGLDEVVWQFAYKSDGVGEEEGQVFDRHFPDRSIECSKEFVFREHIGLGEEVHEGRFAYVGVPDERDAHHFAAVLALRRHLFVDGLELLAQERYALTDDPFIRLYLGLTHTTVGATTYASVAAAYTGGAPSRPGSWRTKSAHAGGKSRG